MLQLERSKIYVNLDGIRAAAYAPSLREAFSRYMAFGHSALSQSFIEELLGAVNKAKAGDSGSLMVLINVPKDERNQILGQLLKEIRDEFASSSESGLDTYLSLNIRHGRLSGQLRSPLLAANLLTTRSQTLPNTLQTSTGLPACLDRIKRYVRQSQADWRDFLKNSMPS